MNPPLQQMASAAPPRRSSFIVRLWEEARESDAPSVARGSVTNTANGDTLLFENCRALCFFLEQHSGLTLEG